MAGDTVITIIGNLTADPELRFTPSGAAVADFTVASTPRRFDRQTNEWKDEDTLFMRCSVWREAAENVSESLQRGTRVIVTGKLKSRSFETREGEKRTVVEMDVEEVGPSLRSATVKVNKTQRATPMTGQVHTPPAGGWDRPAEQDPWATQGTAQQPPRQPSGGWDGRGAAAPQGGAQQQYDEPPF